MTVSIQATIASTPLPIFAYQIQGASHGNVGNAQLSSSLVALSNAGIDLTTLSSDSTSSVPVQVTVTEDGVQTVIFGGEFVSANYSYARDMVVVHARDWAGPLVDQKRVLTKLLAGNTGPLVPDESATSKGVSTQNQKLSQIVSAIAAQFDLTPDLRLSAGAANDPNVGAIFGDSNDTVLSPTPQSLWGILTRLARQTGNVVYATPQKHLVFGAPGAGLDPLTFSWRVNPRPDGVLGAMDMDIVHNPRRNETFRVLVLSYDPTRQQLTKGQAYVIGANYSTDQGSTVHAGAWSGAQAQAIQTAVGTSGGGNRTKNAIPLYTFHQDGLTQSQADMLAQSMASDIAKRELVATVKANTLPDVQPSQPVSLTGQVSQAFASHVYYVTGYSHVYRMPDDRGLRGEYSTTLTLLDRQPEGTGNPVSAKSKTT